MTGAEICLREQCTGCEACVNICPKQCISMIELPGTIGHLFPEVDESACINCGMCRRVCPSVNHVGKRYPPTAFAGIHKVHAQYLSSTSGGAASAMAEAILEDGGVVYGCASMDNLEIRHIRIDNRGDLDKLKGSKYVQSRIFSVYKDVRKDLTDGLRVLFVGTPCQVAGLRSFLLKEYPGLYTVDLICHGVPSQIFLHNQIRSLVGSRAWRVTFRKGNDMGLRLFDKSGEMIYYSNIWNERYRNIYYNTFIDGMTYRDSCYQCPYACPERVGDVTVGDFWGIGEDFIHDTVNGLSCVLPLTEKGLELLHKSPIELTERSVEEAVRGNSQLRHPSRLNRRALLFRALGRIIGYTAAYRIIESDKVFIRRICHPIMRRIGLRK